MSETEWLPAGTAIYHCPLEACEWTHAEPPPGTEVAESPSLPTGKALTLDEAITASTFATMRDWLTGAERILKAHLQTHSLLEWVEEIRRLSRRVDGLRGEVGQLTREKADAYRVVAILLRRAGGSAFISDEEQVPETGVLVRYPDPHGFTLAAEGGC